MMTRRSQAARRTARAQCVVAADAPDSDAEPDAEPILEAVAETPASVDTAAQQWRDELGTTPEPPAGDVTAAMQVFEGLATLLDAVQMQRLREWTVYFNEVVGLTREKSLVLVVAHSARLHGEDPPNGKGYASKGNGKGKGDASKGKGKGKDVTSAAPVAAAASATPSVATITTDRDRLQRQLSAMD